MGERRRRYAYRDGVARTMISHDDHLTLVVSQDVERILEEIKYLRETTVKGTDNWHAAKLPVPVYEDLKNRGIADDEDAFKRWLNSSEAAPWRVHEGWL
jgi:hypothetical protein